MNYRHAYHAGNPADVFKHIVLIALLQQLRRKKSGFFVLDTHAGTGLYDLGAEASRKTGESEDGIGRLWDRTPQDPLLKAYIDQVKRCNGDGELRTYPGSPLIIRDHLRDGDGAAFCELHSEDAPSLKTSLRGARSIAVHHRDGYEALGALLPPKQARGLVFIDPPFEQRDELVALPHIIARHYRKFAHGIWALWYPIKDRAAVWAFEEAMIATGLEKLMVVEFLLNDEGDSRTLNGSAMLIVKPPFGLQDLLLPALQEAQSCLAGTAGKVVWKWLAAE